MSLSEKKSDDISEEDWVILDRRALTMIKLTLVPSTTFNIANERMTKEFITAPCNMYEKPSTSNNVYLMRRVFNLKLTESQSMDKHLNEFNTIMTQL